MPRLYREPDGSWAVPGQQSSRAERIEVSVSPVDLAARLNAERGAVQPPAGEADHSTPPASAPPPVDLHTSAMETAIGESNGAAHARYLIAAFERLTQLGEPGIKQVEGFIRRHHPAGYFTQATYLVTLLALGEIATGRKV